MNANTRMNLFYYLVFILNKCFLIMQNILQSEFSKNDDDKKKSYSTQSLFVSTFILCIFMENSERKVL